jgi:hypothetical protein
MWRKLCAFANSHQLSNPKLSLANQHVFHQGGQLTVVGKLADGHRLPWTRKTLPQSGLGSVR